MLPTAPITGGVRVYHVERHLQIAQRVDCATATRVILPIADRPDPDTDLRTMAIDNRLNLVGEGPAGECDVPLLGNCTEAGQVGAAVAVEVTCHIVRHPTIVPKPCATAKAVAGR